MIRHAVPSGQRTIPGGCDDLTISVRIVVPERPTSGLGDVLAAFDPAERRGLSLGFLDSSPTGNHGNDRELFFGLDAGTTPGWTDLGKPGPATIMVAGLAVLEDQLYAATWEGPPSDRGHVYRLDPDGWQDCGSPWDCNAVTRLAVHGGRLFAGVSRLRGGGSGMPDSANANPGGRVLRYEGDRSWTDLGQLEGADSIAGLVPLGDDLYAIPMYSEGLFRLVEPGRWAWCGSPDRRLLALGLHDGFLYGAGNDHLDVGSAIAQTAAGWSCRSGRRKAEAASSDTTEGRAGRASASSPTRPRSTRSRRMTARCTSEPGPTGLSTAGRAAAAGSRAVGSALRPRS